MLAPIAAVVLLFAIANGQMCPKGNAAIKDTDRTFMVNKHNEFRSLTAKGKAVNSDGSALPSGKNIFKLSWDCTLEAEAQAVAESNAKNGCEMVHKNPNPFGENLATGYGAKGSATYTSAVFPTSAQMWYDEITDPGYDADIASYEFNTGIGHWSAVVWGKVKRVGCGVAQCSSAYDFNSTPGRTGGLKTKSIIACQYWPAPNMDGVPIYDQGTPCKTNADCGTDATCSASEGLCVDASVNAKTQLPSAATVLAFKPPKIDFNDPAVKKVVSGYGTSGGVVTYSTWNGCKKDGCSVPNGLAGTCSASTNKCVDPNFLKKGCWAC